MGNSFQFHSHSYEGRVGRQSVPQPHIQGEQASCLIVSMCVLRRAELQTAAQDAGWETIACESEEEAQVASHRLRFQMAWVDTDSFDDPSDAETICQSIALTGQVLLVICGREDDPQEEIWARQLGVWLYLPGLALGNTDEIQMICEQGHLMASQLQASY